MSFRPPVYHLTKFDYRLKYRYLLVFFLLSLILMPMHALCQEQSTENSFIDTYQSHRQSFLDLQSAEIDRFDTELRRIDKEIDNIKRRISDRDQEISNHQSKIFKTNAIIYGIGAVQTGIALFLFPLFSSISIIPTFIFGGLAKANLFIHFFIPITAINLFIFLYRKEKKFYNKYRVYLIILLILLILTLFSSPLMAEEVSKEDELVEKLDVAHKVLSLSEHQRFISILESKISKKIQLPALSSGDPLLYVFQDITIESAEYYFTLAALYTHENQIGKAVDAINGIFQKDRFYQSKDHNDIIINSIQFLVQNQQIELAGRGIDVLANDVKNVKKLLELAIFLENKGMQASADKVLGFAINKARTVYDLVELANHFIEQGENAKGIDSLSRALRSAKNIDDLILITKTALTYSTESIIEALIKRLPSISKKLPEHLTVVDLFLENGRREDAASVFSNMISNIARSNRHFKENLLHLVDEAMQRQLLEQAVSAVTKLSMYLGEDAYDYTLTPSPVMESAKGLPDESRVTLPLFYGLLNEELNFTDKAEDAYIIAVLHSITKILKSYGYKIPNSLNEYHLLGRRWVAMNKEEQLVTLDQVYTVLEKEFLRQLKMKNDQKLKEQEKRLEELKDRHANRLGEIERLRMESGKIQLKLVFKIISTLAIIIFLIGVIVGCAVKSYQFSKRLAQQKTYGFISKFIETTGWVRIMSILGIASGLFLVFIAQLLQIFQMTNEKCGQIAKIKS